jgi:branched-chain amino acid transport system substrate-binding protein
VKQAALRNLKGWNFRTTLSDAYQARVVARLLASRGQAGDVNGDGRFKVSIYASDDPYGHGFSDTLKKLLVSHRADAEVEQVFHDVRANPTEYKWAADVARLVDRKNENTGKASGLPDVVVEISFPKFIVGFMRAWRDQTPLLHTHNFRSMRLLETLNISMDGQEGTSQAVLGEGESAQTFSEDLKAQTAQPPAFRDAAAYDAAMTLMLATLHAAKAANVGDPALASGARIRDSLRAINDKAGEPVYAGVTGMSKAIRLIQAGKAIDYVGASGPCDYDANGDIVAQLARFKVQHNRFVDVEKFSCVRGGDCSPVTAVGAR